jgi:hypothetical protein
VLVFVAVDAQQLPVAAVGRVVVVVVVPVVDRQFPEPFSRKLPPAAAADPGKELEGPFAVALLPFPAASPRLGDDPVHPFPFAFVRR